MDIPKTEKHENDMTKTGRFCFNDAEELEKVTGEERYTCHQCGAVYEGFYDKGVLTKLDVHFEGFK